MPLVVHRACLYGHVLKELPEKDPGNRRPPQRMNKRQMQEKDMLDVANFTV